VSWTRRKFLVSSATLCAGSIIAGGSIEALRLGPARDRVRLLITKGPIPSAAFERGLRAAFSGAGFDVDAVVMPARPNLARWRAFGAQIRSGVVLGMVSASEFVLINELVREAGARLLYQGEHAIDDVGGARHTLTTSVASVGVRASVAHSGGAWPESLGFALARVAMRKWEPTAVMTEIVACQDAAPVRASCVSFVMSA